MRIMHNMERPNREGGFFMEENVYRAMKSVGVGNLVLGIMIIIVGIAAGVSSIVSGAKLLRKRKDLMF